MKILNNILHKFIRRILLLLLLPFLATSCVEDVVLPLEDGPTLLVVEGSLTTKPGAHQVKLSLSSNYYDQAAPVMVIGATVSITDGQTVWQLTETLQPGVYETAPTFFAEPGKTYHLDIYNVDFDGSEEHYWTEASCYKINPLDSIKIMNQKSMFGREYLAVFVYMQDDPAVDNYYMGTLFINDKLVTDSINECFFIDDAMFNGNYIAGSMPIFSLGKPGDENADEDRIVYPGDKVATDVYGISKDYYGFIGDIRSAGSGNPFMGPPANSRTNIYPKGKACGYFYVSDIHHATTIYEPE